MPLLDRLRREQQEVTEEPEGRRTIFRTQSLSAIRVRKSIGWKIRDGLGYVEDTLGPHLKKVFPNFIAVHYAYVIGMAIIVSVILYPMKNESYTNALFFASCAVTQAGLNPVDVNKLALYQQIVIYVSSTLTTPIFIHGSLCFLRLYWFERHFDDIREKSKLNFKMRRTATLAARTQSMDRTQTLDSRRPRSQPRSTLGVNDDHLEDTAKETPGSSKPTDSTSSSDLSITENRQPQTKLYNASNGIEHMSESSDDEEGVILPPQNRTIKFVSDENDRRPGNSKPIVKNAVEDLSSTHINPESEGFDPKDVFRSIAMMRDKQSRHYDSGENQGPAIVVHGPAERQSSSGRRNSSLQFELAKPKRSATRNRRVLRKSFQVHTADRNEAKDIDSVIDDDDDDYRTTENTCDDEESVLERAQTNLQLPSSDQSGGVKYIKRSNTLDVPPKRSLGFVKSPTFDKIVKRKIRAPKVLRRRLSSNAVDDQSVEYDSSDSDTDEENFGEENSLRRQMSTTYLSWNPTIGRNSTFVNLSDQQKEELGGVEYRAIKLLAKILIFYYIGFHILGVIFLLPWIVKVQKYQSAVRESGVSLTWWGFFTSASAFNDLGYTLTPSSMVPFRDSPFALLVLSVLVIIGNTGFPILLRFIIWILFKFSKDLSLFKESLGFLLDHPRRCFTLLFPSAPTWWLLFILLALNIIDLVLFIILDLNASVVEDLSAGHKVLDGFFQAVSTRTAGFTCVDLSQLHPAVQVSYMVMMYISVMPLAISIRRTNVYEEQSLGVYLGKQGDDESADESQKPTSFIGTHLRKQLSFDLWFVFLGLFIICIAEGGRIQDTNEPAFGVFQVLFEVVSAYGTVGMSLGYPGTSPSFCGQFSIISKLVIIAMMIRGRHRGLPYSLDRAIMLPSAKMEKRDMYQDLHAGHRLSNSETIGSVDDPVIEFFKSAAPKVIRDRMNRHSFFSSRSEGSSGPRVHRRSTSNSSAHLNPQNHDRTDIETMGGYLNQNHPATSVFRDVHFNHANVSHQDAEEHLSPVQTAESFEMRTMSSNPDGDPIRVAETVSAVSRSTFDIGSRRNSANTA